MFFRTRLAAMLAALLLAACGGGGSEPLTSKVGITSVKVMGDSLADSGTFAGLTGSGYGRIFSVQGSDSEPNVLWTERTAAVLGTPQLCSFYKFNGATFVANPTPGCTSFAIGGGRINNALKGGDANPQSIVTQLVTSAAVNTYTAGDLLLIDGGGNDAADLVGAYLAAASDGGAAYQTLLLTLLPSTTVSPLLGAGATGAAQAGGVYMQALADKFYAAIRTNALDRGAQRIALLNLPGITNTPRFQLVLASIQASAGQPARDQAEALFRSWITAYNQRLAANVGSDKRVTVVDFFASLDDQVRNPAQYGLTNVTTPACPVTGLGSDGLPAYNFETCTATALSAQTPPAGATGGASWWKTYAFSDGFHPTPYGYQLLGQLVAQSLAAAGWL